MGKMDMNPGKYASEKGGFYFSCDEGNAVLLGVTGETPRSEQPPLVWTCPILGLHKFDLESDSEEDVNKLIDLESGSEILYGNDDGPKMLKVPLALWVRLFPEEQYLTEGEWGAGPAVMTHVIALVANEGSSVIRFHFSFE